MSQTHASSRADIDLKIKEAETCYGMGMLEEALVLYEQVGANGNGMDPQARRALGEKIGRLKKEILEHQESEGNGLSAEDISMFKKTLSSQDDIPTLLDGAAALKELGLMPEAAAEYEKLMQLDPSAFDFSKHVDSYWQASADPLGLEQCVGIFAGIGGKQAGCVRRPVASVTVTVPDES